MVILFYDGYKWVIFISLTTFALADLLAAFVGTSDPNKQFRITTDQKSVSGLVTFGIVSFIMLVMISYVYGKFLESDGTLNFTLDIYFVAAALTASLIITSFEAMSSKGLNAIIVPLVTGYFLYTFFAGINSGLLLDFIIGICFAAVIAGLSYKVKFLTLNGSIATFLLAGFIFGLGGLKWSVPIMTFFILSSILSKLRKKANEEVETYFEKTGVRDYMQVIANGGLGGILVILNSIYYDELFYLIYLSTLAAVCADTWATEIGTLRKTATYNILNFKPTTQGISGGISLPGTAGAFLGSFAISLSGVYWINFDIVIYFILILFAGVFGSLFDSLLGATVQAQHKCIVCDKVTEKTFHCGKKALHIQGLIWINNDMVNMLAGIAGAVILLLIKSMVNI